GRKLILLLDGTKNELGRETTNIARLARVLAREDASQLVYYDPGVGTLPDARFWTNLGRHASQIIGYAFGAGLFDKVTRAYDFLMRHWEPGDQVYLFGFSRGAYTARAVCAVLQMFGLLRDGHQNLLPYVMRRFRTASKEIRRAADKTKTFWSYTDEIRNSFARPCEGSRDRRFPVHFLGLFDTVSSVGWFWDPVKLPYTASLPNAATIRHAIAIDERRAFFRQHSVKLERGSRQDLQQLWFRGVHSDIGGGYDEQRGALWRVAFDWMVEETRRAGLRFDEPALQAIRNTAATSSPETEAINRSLTFLWWPAELFPKLRWSARFGRKLPMPNFARYRRLPKNAQLHPSVKSRRASQGEASDSPNLREFWKRPGGTDGSTDE
ncbi:MAG: DUF2235 domain-containing protein, partial [Planctomycetes bacterium]|nr:DUF2235 domain-containing protein [Planctomycetota bacterium]